MDAWAYYLQGAAAATQAAATKAAARATAEGEAAMTLLQLSSGFRGGATPPAEPEEEPLPAAVAESQITVPQVVPAADHVADSQPQDAPQAVEHVSSGASAGALLPLIPPGYLSGAAALHKSREDMFGTITGSSSSSLAKVAASSSSGVVRDKQKGKLVVPDAAKKPTITKKRRLDDIQAQLQEAHQDPPAPRPRIPLPLPASGRTFGCTRCDDKFSTFQALGGHMAGHSRANKYHVAACALQRSLHQGGGAVPRANTAAGASSGLGQRIILPPPPQPPTAPIIKNLIASSRMADKLRVELETSRAAIDAAAASSAPAAPRAEPRDFDLNEMPSEE